MAKNSDKHNRMQQLTIMLKSHPEGLRKAEIARRLGIHRSTVGRYIDQLSLSEPLWERNNLIGIEKDEQHDDSLQFNMYEGTFLLALIKLYQQELNIKNPHASSVIRKLSDSFADASDVLSEAFSDAAEKIEVDDKLIPRNHISNFEKLSIAWVNQQAVEMKYLHHSTGESCSCIFDPKRFFVSKPDHLSSELSICGLCRLTGERCGLKISDFSEIEYYVDEAESGKETSKQQCPVSESARSSLPVSYQENLKNLELQESNHRIKNNLFMISGLVDVTFSDIEDEAVQLKSIQLQSRIDVIAELHEQLTCGNGSELINLRTYINSLAHKVIRISATDPDSVSARIRVSDINLSSSKTLPFGMIIAELLSDSFACHGGLCGNINLSVTGENGIVRLRYSDGGSGDRPDSDDVICGSRLINDFCKQLNCTTAFKNNFFLLEFPV